MYFEIFQNKIYFENTDRCDAITARQTSNKRVMTSLATTLFCASPAASMRVFRSCFAVLRPADRLRTTLAPPRSSTCFYHSLSPDLGPHNTTVRTRTCPPSSQISSSFLNPRLFSTSPIINSDAVGKIETKHYQLVYTCKVIPAGSASLSISMSLAF